ncbi:MAG: SseB family protein [Brachybacterium sp.]|nr:SseB family protein [Brachybacterium sp.]
MTGASSPRDLPAHFREKSPLTDTAGVPWQGRDYTTSPFPGDDGSAPEELAAALAACRAGEDPHRARFAAQLATSRVLVPIMATATELGTTAHGLTGDNGADMAMVSITREDGARILPIFSSTSQLAAWRTEARPVPVVAPQAAQAAVQEGCTALLVDAADERGPILLQRSILWALAQGRPFVPPHEDPELAAELDRIAAQAPAVTGLRARAGAAREVDLAVRLVAGLDAPQVQGVVAQLSGLLGASPLVAERITSLKLTLEG